MSDNDSDNSDSGEIGDKKGYGNEEESDSEDFED